MDSHATRPATGRGFWSSLRQGFGVLGGRRRSRGRAARRLGRAVGSVVEGLERRQMMAFWGASFSGGISQQMSSSSLATVVSSGSVSAVVVPVTSPSVAKDTLDAGGVSVHVRAASGGVSFDLGSFDASAGLLGLSDAAGGGGTGVGGMAYLDLPGARVGRGASRFGTTVQAAGVASTDVPGMVVEKKYPDGSPAEVTVYDGEDATTYVWSSNSSGGSYVASGGGGGEEGGGGGPSMSLDGPGTKLADGRLVFVDVWGTRTYFAPVTVAGQLASEQDWRYDGEVDPWGNATTVTLVQGTGSFVGEIAAVERHLGGSGGEVVEKSVFEYTSASGTAVGSTTYYRKPAAGGSLTAYAKVVYDYYGTGDSYGLAGQLRKAELKDGSGSTTLATRYFMYWTDGGQRTGKLRMAFEPRAYARMVAEHPSLATTPVVADMLPYSFVSLSYDTSGEISALDVAGAGTTSGTNAGRGTYTVSYADMPSGYSAKRAEVHRPDGSVRVVVSGQDDIEVMSAYWNGQHGASAVYSPVAFDVDVDGRTAATASPSAVAWNAVLLDENTPDFPVWIGGGQPLANYVYWVNDLGNDEIELVGFGVKATSGRVDRVTFVTDVASDPRFTQVTDVSVSQGAGTNAATTTLVHYTYDDRSAYISADAATYHSHWPTGATNYPSGATGARVTSYANGYGTGKLGPSTIVTTLPSSATAVDPSGTNAQVTTVLDALGYPAFRRDGTGAVTFASFDPATGSPLKVIADADLTRTNDFAGAAVPSGWSNAHTPLHLVSTYELDLRGRVTRSVSPRFNAAGVSQQYGTYVVYSDTNREVRQYAGWDLTAGGPTTLAPVAAYRQDWAHGYDESLAYAPGTNVSTASGRPLGTESIATSSIVSASRSVFNISGQLVESRRYFDLGGATHGTALAFGSVGTNYYATAYGYDAVGRLSRVTLPTGTVYDTEYDQQGRPAFDRVGTNVANLAVVGAYQYDGGQAGGDSLLTAYAAFPDGQLSRSAARVTLYGHDWLGRVIWTKQGALLDTATNAAAFALNPAGEVSSTNTPTWANQNGYNRPLTYLTYNDLGELLTVDRFDGHTVSFTASSTPTTLSLESRRVGHSTYAYDDLGRVASARTYSVSATGTVGTNSYLASDRWYDAAGRVSRALDPNGAGWFYAYDGAGRLSAAYAAKPEDVRSTNAFTAALSAATVFEQTEYLYDRDGHALRATVRQRDHDAASTAKGALRAEGGAGNRGYFYRWSYDAVGRLTASVNLGTRYYDVLKGDFGGGIASDSSSNAPNGSFDIGDVDAFLLALNSPSAYAAINPSTTLGEVLARGDFGGDESLDGSYNTPETYFDGFDSEGFFLAMSDPSRYAEIQPVPQRGGDALVTTYAYDPAGRLSFVTDPRGIANSYVYDLAGRTTKTVENNTTTNALGGTLTATANRLTSYKYDAMGRVTEMTATNVSGGQTTGFSYAAPSTSYSGVFSNESLRKISHTSYTAGTMGAAQEYTETFDVNAAGERIAKTDRNGTGHLYTYDALGRLRADRVTNAATWSGGGVDRTVLALRYDYDAAGRLAKAVSVRGIGTNLATPSLDQTLAAGNAANTVTLTYDGLGNLTKDIQDVIVGGTVTPTGSVAYTWSAPSASVNSALLTGMAYKAESLTYAYDALSRVTSMSGKAVGAPSAGSVEIEAYDYLGLSTVVRVLRAEQAGAGGSLTYVAVGSEGTNAWAGDKYNGLDRFGRVADRRWVLGSTASGADADRLKYGYDAGSNPLYKLNTLSSAHSEVFTYDGLGRLATFDRGSVAFSGSGVATVASPTRSQDWTLDTLGNWDSLTTDGGTPVSRTHDRQNRLTTLAGQSLTYDANGNQLTDEAGNVLVYDAWDRNVGWYNPDTSGWVGEEYVFDEDGNPAVTNPYDALGRRVSRRWTGSDFGVTSQTDTAYLSAPDGRRLWERVDDGLLSGVDAGFNVAGRTYVYAATDPNRLAARDTFDRTGALHNGSTYLAERAYVRGDLVGNTTSTAVITSDGTDASVGSTERYAVDPYGDGVVVMDGSFTPKSGNASDRGWNNFFQTGFTDPASGLVHFGAREYDPSQGRWLQQDPAGWPDGVNRYQAFLSNPVNFTDPTGLFPGDEFQDGLTTGVQLPPGLRWGRDCVSLPTVIVDEIPEPIPGGNEAYLAWRRRYIAVGTSGPLKGWAKAGQYIGGFLGGILGLRGGGARRGITGAEAGMEIGGIIGQIIDDIIDIINALPVQTSPPNTQPSLPGAPGPQPNPQPSPTPPTTMPSPPNPGPVNKLDEIENEGGVVIVGPDGVTVIGGRTRIKYK